MGWLFYTGFTIGALVLGNSSEWHHVLCALMLMGLHAHGIAEWTNDEAN